MLKTFRSLWAFFNSAGLILGFLSFGLVTAIAGVFKPEALALALVAILPVSHPVSPSSFI